MKNVIQFPESNEKKLEQIYVMPNGVVLYKKKIKGGTAYGTYLELRYIGE